MLLFDPLLATARRLPDKVALVDRKSRLTYGALASAVDAFAAALQARGIARGDRVAVYLPNVAEAAVAMFGILRAGAVFVPLNPLTRTDKLAALLGDAEAAALVSTSALAPTWGPALALSTAPSGTPAAASSAAPATAPSGVSAVASSVRLVVIVASGAEGGDRAVPPPAAAVPVVAWAEFLGAGSATAGDPGLDENDLAAIVYTSGSTGNAKGVMLTHLNMSTVASAVGTYLGLVETDVLYCALPLSFSYGICQLTTAFPVGATVVLDTSFAFPMKSLAWMAAEGVTCFAGVPTMYALLAGLPALAQLAATDLRSLRMCTNAADAIADSLLSSLRRALPQVRFFSMYGQTECQRVTYLPPEDLDRRPGSVGRGMPHQEVWLVDDEGRRLPPGHTGELVVRGRHVMRGYWRKPAQTAEKLRPGPAPAELVLFTGDLFRTDEDGYLYFVARKDDLIKSRGEKVSPREVENVIAAMPGVAAVAVVGVPDAMLGQAIKAFLVSAPGAALGEREVIRFCRERLESYMVPHQVAFVPELPTTLTGKVRRAGLREGAG